MNSLPRFTQLAYAADRARVIPRQGGKERTMRQPLDGITVVALEQAVAAPFATRQLADLGARVIKVERPGPATSRAATTAPCTASPATSSG